MFNFKEATKVDNKENNTHTKPSSTGVIVVVFIHLSLSHPCHHLFCPQYDNVSTKLHFPHTHYNALKDCGGHFYKAQCLGEKNTVLVWWRKHVFMNLAGVAWRWSRVEQIKTKVGISFLVRQAAQRNLNRHTKEGKRRYGTNLFMGDGRLFLIGQLHACAHICAQVCLAAY